MSLFSRKTRPVKRQEGALRDDRLFLVACDDTYAPKQYFDFFQIPRVNVVIVPTIDGSSSAQHVLNRLIAHKERIDSDENDESWLLLDTDHYLTGSHRQGFQSAINEARQRGVNIAISKPCFELWLLLHHVSEMDVVTLSNASETESRLRQELGQYNKKQLRARDFPVSAVRDAILRAEKLDTQAGSGNIPEVNSSQIYRLWKAIIANVPASQLPQEFMGF